jgi:peptide/nickel transport system substrate-binding protein
VDSVSSPDPQTVVFKLKDVNAAMLTMFALPWNCIYSAAKLKEDPTFPTKTVMGTGPFRFVEHVKGSHWVGRRFDEYHVPGQPYLDGFRATFIPNPSAMLNAMQGGAVKAEFRGLTPNERDRLTESLGPKIRSEESSEPTVLLITFNTQKKPFDDVRVRRALTMAIDRWAASEGLQKQSRLKTVGGVMRPGSPFAISDAELEKFPGFGRNIEAARAEAKRLLKEAGVENLSFVLTNRNNPPYTTTGVYAVDQWRRIGVNVEHRPVETAPWTQALTSGNFDVIVEFGSDVVDEPSLRLSKHISADRSPINASRAVDRELDTLYDRQLRATDEKERLQLVRAFEKRFLEEAHSVPFLWAQRIVATYTDVHGWVMSPSNSLGQDLAGVWLAK